VLGVTVVLADGTIANSGGKVVKNVAGYDLGKLFCGSRGTLGLIARVSLRLHPLPETARSVVAPVESPADAQRLAQLLARSPLVPSAADLLWPGRLAVLFEGGRRAVAQQVEHAASLLGCEEADPWVEVAERQSRMQGRLSFPPGELAETLEQLPEAVVRVAAGVAYVPNEVADPRDEAVLRLTEHVRGQFDPAETLA
jgi:glycolate oxidase FAD binding subunit